MFKPGGMYGAKVVVPQSDVVHGVPGLDWRGLPEWFSSVPQDHVDTSISIVNKHIQLSLLLLIDLLKNFLHLFLLRKGLGIGCVGILLYEGATVLCCLIEC